MLDSAFYSKWPSLEFDAVIFKHFKAFAVEFGNEVRWELARM